MKWNFVVLAFIDAVVAIYDIMHAPNQVNV